MPEQRSGTPVSDTTGARNLGNVGATGDIITGTCNGANTCAAAGNYTAGDVISNSATSGQGKVWTFANCARLPGGTGWITGAMNKFSAQSMVARTRWWVFHTLPTASELDDNDAFSLDADDEDKLAVPYPLEFTALADHGEVVCGFNYDKVEFKCAAGDRNLYVVQQFVDAETNEAAGMTCKPLMSVLQN